MLQSLTVYSRETHTINYKQFIFYFPYLDEINHGNGYGGGGGGSEKDKQKE
jgi:hypothetical protein